MQDYKPFLSDQMIWSSSLRIPENYSCDLGKEQENDPIDHTESYLQNQVKETAFLAR